jgi:hypothetical protein
MGSVNKAQEKFEEPGNICFLITCLPENKGLTYVSNFDLKNRKKFLENPSRLMSEIFKQLIIDFGSSIVEIEIMISKNNSGEKKNFYPAVLELNYININKNGEGKFLAKSKVTAKRYIQANKDASFPFDYRMITQVAIDLEQMKDNWTIRETTNLK